MKLALVCEARGASVFQVLTDLQRGLGLVRPDWETSIFTSEDLPREKLTPDFAADYDLIHFGAFSGLYEAVGELGVPTTANIWQVPHRAYAWMERMLLSRPPGYAIVEDTTALQVLGQLGYTRVAYIPMPFDPARWPRVSVPEEPFTVGVFGENSPGKRFDIVRRACEQIGVRAYMMFPRRGTRHVDLNPAEDVYSRVHVLAHASFIDTSSRPAIEALACGVPIVSTLNEGLRRLHNGANITFCDGSIDGFSEAIQRIQADYEFYRAAAAMTLFPLLDKVTERYVEVFERVLTEAA